MSRIVRRLALIAVCAVGLAPATAAQAQWYGGRAGQRPAPLYPYELQPGQAYAVQVGPGTYVIHHPGQRYGYSGARHRIAPAATPRPKRTRASRALIEELRRRDAQRAASLAARRAAKHAAALKRAAARQAAKKFANRAAKKAAERAAKRAPRKVEKTAGRKPDKIIRASEVVHDKPLVIVKRRVVEEPVRVITRRHYVDNAPARARDVEPRVIHADAEITILGPDRMSIRLVRKQGEPLVIGDVGSAKSKPNKRFKKRK